MNYPDFRKLSKLQYELVEYARLKCEQGNSGATKDLILELERILTDVCNQIQELPDDETLFQQEPDDLNSIQALRRDGPRKIWSALPDDETLYDKLAGALYGRVIGCLLGVPVEGMTVESIQGWCDFIGKQFPPIDYWENIEMPYIKNCYNRHRYEYLKHTMTYAPVDDDIIYT
ncbi:MAG: ADP-ribosylglycohydrolase family protein, partial [Oscillospiraceae bacterium]